MDGPFDLSGNAAEVPALGAWHLAAEVLSLLAGSRLHGASGQAASSGNGHSLHLGQIHVQAGPLVAKNSARDDLSPTARRFSDGIQFFGGQLP
jgi:hypothetical protein